MVDEAHGEVKIALQELRDLARGIHPAILTDRGLGRGALRRRRALHGAGEGDRGPARPAGRRHRGHRVLHRLRAAAERHASTAGATTRVGGRVAGRGPAACCQVTDDGHGGADLGAGTGLAGLAERLDSVDGLLVMDSPKGGPTSVTAELPWRG